MTIGLENRGGIDVRAVDVLAEIAREIEQFGFMLDCRFVGAAGQIQPQAERKQMVQQRPHLMDQ